MVKMGSGIQTGASFISDLKMIFVVLNTIFLDLSMAGFKTLYNKFSLFAVHIPASNDSNVVQNNSSPRLW
jgi:hypothetical protein